MRWGLLDNCAEVGPALVDAAGVGATEDSGEAAEEETEGRGWC